MGELMGNRNTNMTKQYGYLVQDTLKKAMDEAFKNKIPILL
jgi:hypothetical protein